MKMTQSGKEYKKATLKDEQGGPVEVSVWADYQDYSLITPGTTVEGVIRTTPDGKYKNLVKELQPPKFIQQSRGAGMAKAQETKAKYIEQAQARKSDSIAYFNAINSAIALLDTKLASTGQLEGNPEAIQDFIRYWRDWFINEWEHNQNPSVKID